jgi:hypothetical protein
MLASGGGIAAAQTPITVQLRDGGPGIAPQLVAQTLTHPYSVVAVEPTRYVLPRDSTTTRTLIVLGRDVVIEGQVKGDVLVIAGDLYMHPGGSISGRAISIGGGVYESSLATIGGGVTRFDDFTYTISLIPESRSYALDYQAIHERKAEPFSLPGFFGFRVPIYDRSDGLSLAVGPRFEIPNTRTTILPRLTYRSQLGRIDPSLVAIDSIDRRTAIRVVAERGTYSNEEWIRSDLVNSTDFFFAGSDARNYYRADRGELSIARRWETVNGEFTPSIGAEFERAYSVRPFANATGGPWSFLGKHDVEEGLRPNPDFPRTDVRAALLGATWRWERNGIDASASAREEIGSSQLNVASDSLLRIPIDSGRSFASTPVRDGVFSQLTLHGTLRFPTFGTQSFRFESHVVLPTSGGNTPPQRFVYLGGSGTLPTLDMLELGGDHLMYFDFRYNIPIDRVTLPVVGPPVVTIREALGGAAVGGFPTLHQNTGVRLSASFVYAEWLYDPVAHRGHSAYGVSLAR